MAGSGKSEYVCTLSEEMLKRAKEELNEDPDIRKDSIEVFRSKILKTPALHIQTDDAYLVKFLRAAEFNEDAAFELAMRYFEMKADGKNKKLFTDVRPSAVKHVLDAGITGKLDRDKFGRKVMVFRPGRWDPDKYEKFDLYKTNFMTLLKFIQDEETQVTGVVILFDMKNMGFGHLTHMSPMFVKRIVKLWQQCIPCRIRAIHFVNEPGVFDFLFAMFKPFMNHDTMERIHVHGHNFQELLKFFDEDQLPQEYGGKAPPFTNEDWANILLACDAEFDAEAENRLVKKDKKHKTEEVTESLSKMEVKK